MTSRSLGMEFFSILCTLIIHIYIHNKMLLMWWNNIVVFQT